jgi:ABC-type nitrate/sulfonate/bicarbonate transport system substrate-binding protein
VNASFSAAAATLRRSRGTRGGSIQIGLDPKPYLVCEAKNRGSDVVIVGGWLNTPAYGFIAAKGRGIKSLEVLPGRKVSAREPDGTDVRYTGG